MTAKSGDESTKAIIRRTKEKYSNTSYSRTIYDTVLTKPVNDDDKMVKANTTTVRKNCLTGFDNFLGVFNYHVRPNPVINFNITATNLALKTDSHK